VSQRVTVESLLQNNDNVSYYTCATQSKFTVEVHIIIIIIHLFAINKQTEFNTE